MADLHSDALKDQQVHSHVGIAILIGDEDVGSGRIQSGNARHGFGQQAVHGVGDYNPVEHAPLRYDGTFTIDAFRIRKRDLVRLKLAALGSGILKMGIFKIQIYDKISKKVIRTYLGCSIDTYDERFQEGAICGENVTIKFLEAIDHA